MNGYLDEINKNMYLTVVPTNEIEEIIKSCGVKSDIYLGQ